jgi:hypothetical protein
VKAHSGTDDRDDESFFAAIHKARSPAHARSLESGKGCADLSAGFEVNPSFGLGGVLRRSPRRSTAVLDAVLNCRVCSPKEL